MSKTLDDQVKIEDLIERYEALREEIATRLEDADGEAEAKLIERLRREINVHGHSVGVVLKTLKRVSRPKIGDVVTVVNYEYDRCGGIFDDSYEQGTIVGVDGDEIEVRIPEETILETIPEHTVRAEWHPCVKEWVNSDTDLDWYVTQELESEDSNTDQVV